MSEVHVVGAMIVKNEAENLPGLFASARGVVDAWVIVDTGSTDETINVAHALGQEHGVIVVVHEDPWDDDFARSRNVCLDLIDVLCGVSEAGAHPLAQLDPPRFGAWSSRDDDGEPTTPDPWILILDGDDRIDGDRTAFREALLDPDPRIDVIGLPVRSHIGKKREDTLQPRLWRVSSGVRYKHRVHMAAQVTHLNATSYADAWIRHIGYDADPTRNARRTLRIAALMEPDDQHRLYVESRAYQALNQYDDAVRTAMRSIQLHRAGVPTLHSRPWQIVAQAALLQGNSTTALGILAEGAQLADSTGSTAPDLWAQVVAVAGYGLLGHTLGAMRGAPGTHGSLVTAPRILSGLEHGGALVIPQEAKDEMAAAAGFHWLETQSHDLEGWTPRRHVPAPETAKTRPVLFVTDTNAAGQAGYLAQAMGAPCIVLQQDYIDFPLPDNALVLSDLDDAEPLYELVSSRDWFFHFVRHPVSVGKLDWREILTPHNCLVQYLGSPLRKHAHEYMAWHKHTGIMGVSAWDWTMLERSWLPYHMPLIVPDHVFARRAPAWRGKGVYRICHPTTNRRFKKTEVFLDVVDALKADGVPVEAVVIEGKSNAECMEIKRTCHATFDQFAVGIYGMSGAESIALGHTVYSDLNAWAKSIHPDAPVRRVRDEHELAEAIRLDVANPAARGLWGDADTQRPQIEWAQRIHGAASVTARWRSLYEHIQGVR